MLLFLTLACTTMKKEAEEEEAQTFTNFRILQDDYEYTADGSELEGQRIHTYETSGTRFYTTGERTHTVDGETELTEMTATLDSNGYWDVFSLSMDGEPKFERANYEYDEYGHIIYNELTGEVPDFEDTAAITYAEYEYFYDSDDVLEENEDRIYWEDGSPYEITHTYYFMSDFEPCPSSPFFRTINQERFLSNGTQDFDRTTELDENGYPTSLYSESNGWNYSFQFELDENGKPLSYQFINNVTGFLYAKYEFSYAAGKFNLITKTEYDEETGEIAELSQYEIALSENPLEDTLDPDRCFFYQKDMDGNYLHDRWELDSWTNVSRRYTRYSAENEEIGYHLQELETYSFEMIEE